MPRNIEIKARIADLDTTRAARDEEAGACRVPKGPPLVVVRKRREVLLRVSYSDMLPGGEGNEGEP